MNRHLINPDCCTACTACIAHCPVSAVTNNFRGPKMLGPALERMRVSEQGEELSLDYCTNCKNCDMACPSGVPISTLNMRARAQYYKNHKQGLRDDILSHGEKAAKICGQIPGMASLANIGMKVGRKLGLLRAVGIAEKAPLPAYASKSFIQQFKEAEKVTFSDKVVFFPGCFINYNDPQVGMDFVEVMKFNKIEVIVDEEFVCCGSPLLVNGFIDEVHDHAIKNMQLMKKWIEKGYNVITCCTSCGLMLKQEYQELFGFEEIRQNAKYLYDAMEYLVVLAEKGRLNTKLGAIDKRYMYHAPCHLRAQGFGLPALDVLAEVPEIDVENADVGCCGISGNYGFKADKYEVAMEIGKNLFNKIKTANVDTVISDCGTCRLQIGHGADVKTVHPISILRMAYELWTE